MNDDKADDPLETVTGGGTGARPAPAEPPQLADYRPIQQVGEGGFGEVWLAEQLRPVQRKVALKLIKPGMDSKQVLGRFESERQALALMEHPYIAKVFDAGITRDRRPYFVMEYVKGVPITVFCDRHRLDTRARLELIVKVCQGVQHAHQKAIIHRDIKPSNVLVTESEDGPLPKIIDFGVAKATGQRLTDHTVFTLLGNMIGTPEYMSPEQAELSGEDIDTRTDVYSLGVVLYELLVGVLPVGSPDLRRIGVDEIRRRIREDDPLRPSTRISSLGPGSQVTASNRRTELTTLQRQLRGDLDWIAMRALEKERARRYASPGELAADIVRYLNDEPVLARPPSVAYRARKFARRHRVAVAAAALVLLALIGGLAVATYGLVRATRAEAAALREAATARRVSEFMVELFESPAPDEARGNTVTAREILDRGVERIRQDLADEPEVQAPLMETMGRVYTAMGLYRQALPLLDEAVAIREQDAADDPLALASALTEQGAARMWLGEYDEAAALGRRAVELRERQLGPQHPDVAESLNLLGNALQNAGTPENLAGAAAAHRRAAEIREAALGPASGELAISLHNLAIVHYFQGETAEAERLYRRSIEIEERRGGEDNHRLATSLHTLAILLKDLERFDDAVPLEERSLRIREAVLGPDHPHTAYSLTTLGELRMASGRPELAEPLLRRATAIAVTAWSPVYRETRWMRRTLAQSLIDQAKLDEAEAVLRALLDDSEQAAAADAEAEGTLPPTLSMLGGLLARARRYDEAEDLYRRSLAIDERLRGTDHPYLVQALHGLANVARDRGRHDAAAGDYERALQILDATDDPDADELAAVLNDYATCLSASGASERAREIAARAAALAARER